MAAISPGAIEELLADSHVPASSTASLSGVDLAAEAHACETTPPPIFTKEWWHFARDELLWVLSLDCDDVPCCFVCSIALMAFYFSDATRMCNTYAELLVLLLLNVALMITEDGAPMSGTFILGMVSSLIMLFFVGHLGRTELAAAGLGYSVFNFFAYSFGLGLCGALDTFCSQAYGAGAYAKLGTYLQRAILVNTVYIMIMLPLMFNAYSILVAVGQDPDVSALAAFFVKIMGVSLWPLLLYESLKRFLNAQGISTPLLTSSIVYVGIVTLGLYLTIHVMKLGFAGAPISMATANAVIPLVLLLQAYFWHPTQMQQTWRGWTRECLRGWMDYLRMGVPAAVLLCTEWWAFEILILLSGLLGVSQLAASQVHLSVINFVYMLPLGVSIAVNTRVGNLLGAGEPFRARGVMQVSLMFTWAMMLTICFALLAVRNYWGRLYTNDPDVISLVATVLPIASLTVVLDGNQAVCQGILRAAGLQKLGAILNFVCYYIICIPLAVLMAFVFKWDIVGLWISIATAEVCVVVAFLWALWTVDWKEQATLARERHSTDDIRMTEL